MSRSGWRSSGGARSGSAKEQYRGVSAVLSGGGNHRAGNQPLREEHHVSRAKVIGRKEGSSSVRRGWTTGSRGSIRPPGGGRCGFCVAAPGSGFLRRDGIRRFVLRALSQ